MRPVWAGSCPQTADGGSLGGPYLVSVTTGGRAPPGTEWMRKGPDLGTQVRAVLDL